MQHGYIKDEHDMLQVIFDMSDAKMTIAASPVAGDAAAGDAIYNPEL
jgi:hypothetical protein